MLVRVTRNVIKVGILVELTLQVTALILVSEKVCLPIPSYFRPTLYTKGGSSGPPTISSTLGCTNIKFCKVLEIPFKVSENTRFVKILLYGYHGNCLITWCFSLIIVKMIMKSR